MSKNDPHILGKERIGKLLLQYSIPAIIEMTITFIYIDSIFIGHGVRPMAIGRTRQWQQKAMDSNQSRQIDRATPDLQNKKQ